MGIARHKAVIVIVIGVMFWFAGVQLTFDAINSIANQVLIYDWNRFCGAWSFPMPWPIAYLVAPLTCVNWNWAIDMFLYVATGVGVLIAVIGALMLDDED